MIIVLCKYSNRYIDYQARNLVMEMDTGLKNCLQWGIKKMKQGTGRMAVDIDRYHCELLLLSWEKDAQESFPGFS
jgi:hypothetical protein